MAHIYVIKLNIIGSDNGLSPGRRQAIIWINAGILLIRPLWTNVGEIFIEIHIFSFKKMYAKTSSAKRRPFCPSGRCVNWKMCIYIQLMSGGPAFLRPNDEFTTRLCFVNFDGKHALAASKKLGLESDLPSTFVREHCGEMYDSMKVTVSNIHYWIIKHWKPCVDIRRMFEYKDVILPV